MTRRFACSFILLSGFAACCCFAQEAPHSLFCVVQNPIHSGKELFSSNHAQDTGVDARELTIELSQRTRNGTPVTAVSLTRDAKSTDAAIERVGCPYIIYLERHEPAETDSDPDDPGAGVVPMSDWDMIMYSLRSHESRKKILSGSVLPTTWRGHSERPVFVPYPVIADAVLKKILKIDPLSQKR